MLKTLIQKADNLGIQTINLCSDCFKVHDLSCPIILADDTSGNTLERRQQKAATIRLLTIVAA
ncbi:MAG: hypothetical protein HON70_38750 [Lentisphaerae bacterium]|nr:hypothetical protein [Lentisphaerota bacterium]